MFSWLASENENECNVICEKFYVKVITKKTNNTNCNKKSPEERKNSPSPVEEH